MRHIGDITSAEPRTRPEWQGKPGDKTRVSTSTPSTSTPRGANSSKHAKRSLAGIANKEICVMFGCLLL